MPCGTPAAPAPACCRRPLREGTCPLPSVGSPPEALAATGRQPVPAPPPASFQVPLALSQGMNLPSLISACRRLPSSGSDASTSSIVSVFTLACGSKSSTCHILVMMRCHEGSGASTSSIVSVFTLACGSKVSSSNMLNVGAMRCHATGDGHTAADAQRSVQHGRNSSRDCTGRILSAQHDRQQNNLRNEHSAPPPCRWHRPPAVLQVADHQGLWIGFDCIALYWIRKRTSSLSMASISCWISFMRVSECAASSPA